MNDESLKSRYSSHCGDVRTCVKFGHRPPCTGVVESSLRANDSTFIITGGLRLFVIKFKNSFIRAIALPSLCLFHARVLELQKLVWEFHRHAHPRTGMWNAWQNSGQVILFASVQEMKKVGSFTGVRILRMVHGMRWHGFFSRCTRNMTSCWSKEVTLLMRFFWEIRVPTNTSYGGRITLFK